MVTPSDSIIVRQLYTDFRHREVLRCAYREEHRRTSTDGQETYFKEMVCPTIEQHLHRILVDTTGKSVNFDFEPWHKNRKVLTDFVQEDDDDAKKTPENSIIHLCG